MSNVGQMHFDLPFQRSDFARDEHGFSAVEFGLIAPFFLAIVLVWIEIGMCLIMSSTLDNAVRDASRLIRIGSATEANFKDAVCAKLTSLIPCSGIVYSVQSATSFAGISAVTSTGGAYASTGYNGGSPGSNVLVQVGYLKPALIGPILTPLGFGNGILISSTLAFRNENY